MKIAVVTGASSGMGREFVYALDKQTVFDEIWVFARRKDRLLALQQNVSAKIVPFALDLTKKESLTFYKAELEEKKPEIKVLVNASGFGKFKFFPSVALNDYEDMIDLNCKALVSMTYLSLPYMKENAQIYQMGSLSSFQPVPCINVYGASKAFVLSFSRALNVELKPRKISVMAVCPGWVLTEFFDRAVDDDTVSYYNVYRKPEDVVKNALADMQKGKDVSVYGGKEKTQVRLTKLLPHKTVMKVWSKQQKLSLKLKPQADVDKTSD